MPEWLASHEQVLELRWYIIKPLPPSRLRDGSPLLGHQLLGGLVVTDYGPLGVIGFGVEVHPPCRERDAVVTVQLAGLGAGLDSNGRGPPRRRSLERTDPPTPYRSEVR